MQKYSTLLILLLFFACAPENEKDKIPADVLQQGEMADILSDMHIAEALVRTTPHNGDTNTQQVIDYYGFIYKKYQTTEEAFKKSYDYYMHHPVLLDSVYSEVVTKLSDKEVRFKGK